MTKHTCTGAWRQAARLACALAWAALAACGGGSGDGTEPTAGPGPQPGADYFPLQVGDRWIYDDGSGTPSRADVTGTQSLPDGMGLVVRSVDADGTTDEIYLKSSTAVTVQPTTAGDPVLLALGPLKLLKLPLATGSNWVLADKTLQGIADLDGDGRVDDVVLHIEATVVGFETVSTPAGSYARSAHVRTTLDRRVRFGAGGPDYVDSTVSDDWYAPDVGLVRNRLTQSSPAGTDVSETQVTGWRAGGRSSDTVAPTIVTRQPASGSVAAGGFPVVSVAFSEAMDTSVAASTVFTLTGPDGQAVEASVGWLRDGRTLQLGVPLALASGRYTARVSRAVTDTLGNGLAADATWSFDVDASGPAATLVSPLPGATEVPLDTVIVLQLDEDPNPDTVNTSTVALGDVTHSTSVEATVTLQGRRVTLTPKAPLTLGTRYTVGVNGIQDRLGNPASAQSWTFDADPGRFAAPVRLIDAGTVTAAAVGDLDGDGRADVVLALEFEDGVSDGKTLFLRRSLGGGRFADVRRIALASGAVRSMVIADLDGRGVQAIVVGGDGGVEVVRRRPDGAMASSQFIASGSASIVRVADMNGDGRPDIVGAPFTGDAVQVWLQGSDGRYGSPTSVPVDVAGFGDMAVGDLDGDGRTDIAVVGGNSVGVVYRLADGGYAAPRYLSTAGWPTPSAEGVTIADVTGDGRADLVLAHSYASQVSLLAQRADGSLGAARSVAAAPQPSHTRVADFDGDGRPDVLSWAWGGYPIGLNRQRSDGSLGAVETWPVGEYGSWYADLVAVGDLDGDGRLDVVYAGSWLRQRAVAATAPAVAGSAAARSWRQASAQRARAAAHAR